MKQILGDNQFFGVNHYDLDKGEKTKNQFIDNKMIIDFIINSINIGLDGFMINSNSRGYKIIEEISVPLNCEIHYSIPYPHKFASIVNESGMFELLKYVIKNSSIKSLFLQLPQFLITRDIKNIIPLIVELEVPKNLPKGSVIYLQNIVTDLLIGLKRYDLILEFCKIVISMGYLPGLITLNPKLLDKIVSDFDINILKKLIVCFNINIIGFNVFPNLIEIENLVYSKSIYKKMGMSILSSGGANNIDAALEYIKKLPLDYVVYGTSNIKNLSYNYNKLIL